MLLTAHTNVQIKLYASETRFALPKYGIPLAPCPSILSLTTFTGFFYSDWRWESFLLIQEPCRDDWYIARLHRKVSIAVEYCT